MIRKICVFFKSRDSTGLRPVVTQVMSGAVESLSVKNKPPVRDWWFLTYSNEVSFE